MKNLLANILISAIGRVGFPILAGLVSYALAWLAAKIPLLSPLVAQVNTYELAMFLMAAIMSIVLSRVHGTLAEHVRPIQRWLRAQGWDVEDDGWMGEITSAALQEQTGLPVRRAIAAPRIDDAKDGTGR